MDKFKNLPVWGQLLVVLVICGLLIWLIHNFYISPTSVTITSLENKNTTLKDTVTKGKTAKNEVDKLKRILADKKSQLAQLQKSIPKNPEQGEMGRMFANKARDNSLQLGDIEMSGPKDAEMVRELNFKMKSVVGSYQGFAVFFENISEIDRIVNIRDITFQPFGRNARARNVSSSASIKGTFTAVVYIQKPPEPKSTGKQKGKRTKKGGK